MRSGIHLTLTLLGLLSPSLAACAGTERELPVFEMPDPPKLPTPTVPADVSSALQATAPDPLFTASTTSFSAAEVAYIESSAGAVFRRRVSERATGFVDPPSGGGYGVCLRSPKKGGGYDLAMLVLQRRLDGGAISQVDDDTIVLKRARDTARCTSADLRFVPARRG